MEKGIIKPGRKIDDYISVIDIAPTLLEVAGVSFDKSGMQPITGRSFVDILKIKNGYRPQFCHDWQRTP